MTLDDFKRSLESPTPPADLPPAVLALWQDAKGDWEEAHRIAQAVDDQAGAWVHAYLHRKEGDAANASYWYRRAGRLHSRGTLQEEWAEIATALLRVDSHGGSSRVG